MAEALGVKGSGSGDLEDSTKFIARCIVHSPSGKEVTERFRYLFELSAPADYPISRVTRAKGLARYIEDELGGFYGKHVLDLGVHCHLLFGINAVANGAVKCTVVDKYQGVHFAKLVVVDGYVGNRGEEQRAREKMMFSSEEMDRVFAKGEGELIRQEKLKTLSDEERNSLDYFNTVSCYTHEEVGRLNAGLRGRLSELFEFRQQDFERPVSEDKVYGIVHAGYVLTQVGDLDAFLKNVVKVLKEGGLFVGDLQFPESDSIKEKKHDFRSESELRELLEKYFQKDEITILEKDWRHKLFNRLGDVTEYIFFARKRSVEP